MSAPGLREHIGESCITWTLDNPRKRNAIHPDALAWIARRCTELHGEVVVLRGDGDDAFCAGFDLDALDPTPDGPHPDAPLAAATEAMEQADATFIAAINGLTIGAGVELCCACDLRIAVEDAWFAIPAAKLGVVYHAAGLERLHAVLGAALVHRLLLLGERVEATAAFEAGALTHLVRRTALDPTIDATTEALARGNVRSQAAHRTFLRALQRGRLDASARESHARARNAAYADIARRRAAAKT